MPQIFRLRLAAALGLSLACLAAPLAAQTDPAAGTQPADATLDAGECPPAAAMAEPATPDSGPADGTAPENSGSTAWTGGTGGSMIGTNPSGADPDTRTWQPPTARGLDLAGRPEPAPAC